MSFVEGLQQAQDAYWRLSDASSGEDVPCVDPSCEGRAEPERDGEHGYFECTTCGMTFGYRREADGAQDSCAIGVPSEIRARAMVQATPVELTRKPR